MTTISITLLCYMSLLCSFIVTLGCVFFFPCPPPSKPRRFLVPSFCKYPFGSSPPFPPTPLPHLSTLIRLFRCTPIFTHAPLFLSTPRSLQLRFHDIFVSKIIHVFIIIAILRPFLSFQNSVTFVSSLKILFGNFATIMLFTATSGDQ